MLIPRTSRSFALIARAYRRVQITDGTFAIRGGDGDDITPDPADPTTDPIVDAAPEAPTVSDLLARLEPDTLSVLDDDVLDETEHALMGIAQELGATPTQTTETVAAIEQTVAGIKALQQERGTRIANRDALAAQAAAALAEVIPADADPTPDPVDPAADPATDPAPTLAADPVAAPPAAAAPPAGDPVVNIDPALTPAPVMSAATDPVITAPPAATDPTPDPVADPAPANPVPVLAAGRPTPTALERVTARRPAAASPESRPAGATTAPRGPRMLGCDANGITTGAEFATLADAAHVMSRVHDNISRGRMRSGDMHTILSIQAEYPEDRRLAHDNTEQRNSAIVASAMTVPGSDGERLENIQALVASGGLCAPVAAYYGQAHIGDNARPVRAGLPGFSADRGGIRFVPPVKIGTITANQASAAITTITMAQDATSTQKTRQTVTCPAITEVDVTAQAERLQFGNVLARTFPERVQNILEVTMDQLARVAERRLLTQIGLGSVSTQVALSSLGVAADFLEAVTRAAAAYRNRNRMLPTAALEVIAPAWLLDAILVDLTVGVSLDVDFWELQRTRIEGFFTRIGVNITWARDGEAAGNGLTTAQDFAAQSGLGAALVDWPDQAVWYMFHAGAWLYLDGGEINIGLVRDSTLNNTNDYEIMYEFFEDVAFVGLESIRVVQTFCASGTRAAGKDVSAGCTSKVGFGS